MENLKNYRISLKFSEKDSAQTDVAKLLKQLGRKKSSFITKAVKYYLENNPSPEIPGNNNVLTSMITENIVKATILKMIQSGEIIYNPDKKEIPELPLAEENYIEPPQKVKRVEKVKKTEIPKPIAEVVENPAFGEAIENMLDMLDDM